MNQDRKQGQRPSQPSQRDSGGQARSDPRRQDQSRQEQSRQDSSQQRNQGSREDSSLRQDSDSDAS